MSSRRIAAGLFFGCLCAVAVACAQNNNGKDKKPAAPASTNTTADHQMVERVLAARKEYQESLESLRAHYISAGELERAKWAEDELLQYHRMSKHAYRLELDVPPPNLQPLYNIPEANELMRRAILYKDKGFGTDYTDNQRRTELLLQQLLSKHPQSNKIDEAAYMLGDLYESKAYKQNSRAAVYFERCYQWNPKTHRDARVRAARLYEKMGERSKAVEIYKDITVSEHDPKRVEEAQKKVTELKGGATK
jgi:TolA-binding protein